MKMYSKMQIVLYKHLLLELIKVIVRGTANALLLDGVAISSNTSLFFNVTLSFSTFMCTLVLKLLSDTIPDVTGVILHWVSIQNSNNNRQTDERQTDNDRK